jgi:hypothetical protein
MKALRNTLIYVVLLGIIGYSGYTIYQGSLRPCDKPIEYSIGRFDTQFGISKEDFLSYTSEAGSVWEKVLNREEFIYNPNAAFKINLIYDQRQLDTVLKQKADFGLSAAEDAFKKLDADFAAFKGQYDQKVFSYNQALALYQSRKSAYDAEVASWNTKGGAPKNVFNTLNAERQSLNTEVQSLNAEAASITVMGKQLNSLLDMRNAKAVEYNKIAAEYNKKFNGGLEFNQAEYKSGNPTAGKMGEINVYQFGNKKDLILALTHELGHALGMNHVENPKSIMYYITGINADTNLTPSPEDLAELNKVCKI